MNKNIIESLIKELRDGSATQDTITKVAYCFENYNGMPSDAWPDEIKSIALDKEEVKLLKVALFKYINALSNTSSKTASAIWSYGKIADVHDKAYLSEVLRKYLHDNSVIYQVMCVLDSLGEDILNSSNSLFDVEVNKLSAETYLSKQSDVD